MRSLVVVAANQSPNCMQLFWRKWPLPTVSKPTFDCSCLLLQGCRLVVGLSSCKPVSHECALMPQTYYMQLCLASARRLHRICPVLASMLHMSTLCAHMPVTYELVLPPQACCRCTHLLVLPSVALLSSCCLLPSLDQHNIIQHNPTLCHPVAYRDCTIKSGCCLIYSLPCSSALQLTCATCCWVSHQPNLGLQVCISDAFFFAYLHGVTCDQVFQIAQGMPTMCHLV